MMLRRGLFWYSKPNASSKTSGILSVRCLLCAGKWRYVVYRVLLLTQINFHSHSHCDLNTEMGILMTQLYSKWLKITEIQGVWSVRWPKPLSASLWVGRKHFMGRFILLNCHLAVQCAVWLVWMGLTGMDLCGVDVCVDLWVDLCSVDLCGVVGMNGLDWDGEEEAEWL